MEKIDKPEIGAELYSVFGHLYSSKLAPHRVLKEYCVCKGTVRGFYTGSYTGVCLLFQGPGGVPTLSYYKLEDIGKKLFYTAAEAAKLARSMTEKYEQTWGWIGAPEFPMARPWEDLLAANNG